MSDKLRSGATIGGFMATHLGNLLNSLRVVMLSGTATIPVSGWVSNSGDYTYKVNIAITGMTSKDYIDVIIANDDQDKAADCGLAPSCSSYNGGLTFYAKSIPTLTMNFSYQQLM